MEQIVSASFGMIKDNKQEKLVFSNEQHPWKLDQLGHKIYIVPVVDTIQEIRLTFPAPDVRHQYKISVCFSKIVILLVTPGRTITKKMGHNPLTFSGM